MSNSGDLDNSRQLLLGDSEAAPTKWIAWSGKVLDLGCGNGRVSAKLLLKHGNFSKFVLVDKQDDYVAFAEKCVSESMQRLQKQAKLKAVTLDVTDVVDLGRSIEKDFNLIWI